MTSTEIVFGIAGAVGLAGYGAFILVPAWNSYGRAWEKLAASFLSLYMLAALAGIGAVLGVAFVYLYDRIF
jgi:hypothetical protein